MVTYDEAKRQANLKKHGIDFAECNAIFAAPMLTEEDDRLPYGETRLKSYGLLFAKVAVLLWTERDGAAHLISCRYGTHHETRHYFQNAPL